MWVCGYTQIFNVTHLPIVNLSKIAEKIKYTACFLMTSYDTNTNKRGNKPGKPLVRILLLEPHKKITDLMALKDKLNFFSHFY